MPPADTGASTVVVGASAPSSPVTTTAAPASTHERLEPGRPGYRRMSFALFAAGVAAFALLYSTQALLPALRASGDGTIVVLSSTAGLAPYEGGGGYVTAKHGAHAIAGTLRLELCGEPVRVIEVAPGMVRTDEFAVNRFGGDTQKAAAVYAGVANPLTAEDVADTVEWAVTRPSHVNIDLLVVRPRAQAAQHKVHR